MRFGLAFGFFINKTGGSKNLLLLTLCQLIPVVGPIVIYGYRARVAMALIRDLDLRDHFDFDFDRFSKYLMRGLWPFLMGLILSLAFIIPLAIAFGLGIAAGAAAGNAGIGFLVGGLVYFVGIVVLTMLSVPMTFHAGLVNRFDFPEAWRFAGRFWSLVGGQALLTGLLFVPLAMIVSILGFLCCFIGIYPASIIITMAGEHLMVQLYVEYLARGGEPIDDHVPLERPEVDEYEEYDDRRDG